MAALSVAILGQSNAAGPLSSNQVVSTTGPVPNMWTPDGFDNLTDPTKYSRVSGGSMWPLWSSSMADDGVPIGLANLAKDSTSITQWQKGAVEDYYARLTTYGALVGGVDVVYIIIGETDSSNSMSKATMYTNMLALVDDITTDFPGVQIFLCKFPIGDTTGGGNLGDGTTFFNGTTGQDLTIWTGIREAYDDVIAARTNVFDGGDLATQDIHTTTAVGNDGIHMKQDDVAAAGAALLYTAYTTANAAEPPPPDLGGATEVTRRTRLITKLHV